MTCLAAAGLAVYFFSAFSISAISSGVASTRMRNGHIHGELKGLGYKVSWQTVRRMMLDHGLLPDPDRPYKTTWNDFIRSHWDSLAACDFFSVDAWGFKGLTRYLVFFVIEIATRKVEIVGIHADPCETQMVQYARNLTDAEDGFLKDKRILIHDRDRCSPRSSVRPWGPRDTCSSDNVTPSSYGQSSAVADNETSTVGGGRQP